MLNNIKINKKKKEDISLKKFNLFLQKNKIKKMFSNKKVKELLTFYENKNIEYNTQNEIEKLSKYGYLLKLLVLFPDKNKLYNLYKESINEIENKIIILEKELEKRTNSADISNIEKYFYETRKMKRQIICILGPTNSGKTHEAVNELKNSKNGIFLSPLRLLANEIYYDLTKNKINCNLITGDKIIFDEKNTHTSSTIEMVNLNKTYDVAIIDEIQFLANQERGSSWVRTLLGLKAKKIYLIGSLNAEPQIRKIMNKIPNDELEFIYKERLSPLELYPQRINIKDLQNGDCLILFSKDKIYQYKSYLEQFNLNINIIYGDLPHDTKIKQSEEFNQGNSILLATDAIGYGLNLSIKRILYLKVHKYYNQEEHYLSLMEFQQISGRAGRYQKQEKGEVFYLQEPNELAYNRLIDYDDFNYYKSLVKNYNEIETLNMAYFFPELEHLIKFYEIIDSEGKKNISINQNNISLRKLFNLYNLYFKDKNNIFNMINTDSFENNISLIEKIINNENLSLENKYLLSFAPVSYNKNKFNIKTIEENMFEYIVSNIILNNNITFKNYFNNLKLKITYQQNNFKRNIDVLTEYYKNIKLYMWCANRYQNLLLERENAEEQLLKIEEEIEKELKQNNMIKVK